MRARVIVGFTCGAAIGWIAHSERERIAELLAETLERSRVAADALLHGTPEQAAPATQPAADPEPQPEPRFEPVVPPPVRHVAHEPRPLPLPEPPSAQGRRRLAGASAVAAVVCALIAAGAASWQQWGRDTTTPAKVAVPPKTPSVVSHLVNQPGATRLPARDTAAHLTLVVGRSDRSALVGSDLAPAPDAKTYEIWVIRGGEPRKAALFRGGHTVAVPLTRPVPPGATVAVTLEPRRGSASPTSKPLFHITRSLPPAVLRILAQRNALHLPLTGSHGHLTVVVGGADRAILVSSGLPPAPAGKQYEAWIIRGKQVVPAGLFDGGRGRDVIALTHRVPKGAAVAVTLERTGGVSAPTQRPPYVVVRS